MKLPFLNFNCEECQNKGKRISIMSLVAGVALGAGVIYFVKRK